FLDACKSHRRCPGTVQPQTGHEREPQQPMGNRLPEGGFAGRLVIDVQRIKIARDTGEVHHVGLRDRAALAAPAVADSQLVVGLGSRHEASCVGISVFLSTPAAWSSRGALLMLPLCRASPTSPSDTLLDCPSS